MPALTSETRPCIAFSSLGCGRRPVHHRAKRRVVTVAAAACACLTLAGCGGTSKRPPTQKDVQSLLAALSDIVYQCQSFAAGFIAGPDRPSLKRDVDKLVAAHRRVQADAAFVVTSASGLTRRTTLKKELGLAARNLEKAGCSPEQAKQLEQL